MIIAGIILLISITSSKLLYKIGVPILLVFIALGMMLGSDGIGGIYFNDYSLTKNFCTIALCFIMFYGGFGTNWKMAKSAAVPAALMSTLGVIITALLTGTFIHVFFNVRLSEGLLIGSVLSSTDAASVFTILRSQKLNLKGNLASLLEIESGSNDPFAFILILTIITCINNGGILGVLLLIVKQVVFGFLIGIVLAKIGVWFLRNSNFEIKGFYIIFLAAIIMLSYALSEYIGGNGYLSVYLLGIIIGNSKIPHKKSIFHFYDAISWIMQIALFFILGLLSFPSKFINIIGISIGISIFMLVIARPLTTFLILTPFKYSKREKLFVSWVGLRGAASLVFTIYVITSKVPIKNDMFHIVFFVALFSVVIQGTLIPKIAKVLNLVDNKTTVLKTFNDYTGEMSSKLVELNINKDSKWVNKSIMDTEIPEEILIVMIKRNDDIIIPKGGTVIEAGDVLVLSGNNIEELIAN